MPFAARAARRSDFEADARLKEKDKLSAAYTADRRQRIQALCDGPEGERIKDLIRFLKRMDLSSGADLVERIRVADWASALPGDDRHLLLSIISGAIRNMREKNGLPPLDDPILDEPPRVYQQIREALGVQ